MGTRDKHVVWILVEVRFSSGFTGNIDLEWGPIELWQRVDNWGIPFRGLNYHHMGHLLRLCSCRRKLYKLHSHNSLGRVPIYRYSSELQPEPSYQGISPPLTLHIVSSSSPYHSSPSPSSHVSFDDPVNVTIAPPLEVVDKSLFHLTLMEAPSPPKEFPILSDFSPSEGSTLLIKTSFSPQILNGLALSLYAPSWTVQYSSFDALTNLLLYLLHTIQWEMTLFSFY